MHCHDSHIVVTLTTQINLQCHMFSTVGQISSLGIATCHGLDGQGFETWWRQEFLHWPTPFLGLT